jgi:hypothetical protein
MTRPGLRIEHPATGYVSIETFDNDFLCGLKQIALSAQPTLIITRIQVTV